MCLECIDSQEHALECKVLLQHLTSDVREILKQIKYDDLFGNIEITHINQQILKIRKRLWVEKDPELAYQGKNAGPDG